MSSILDGKYINKILSNKKVLISELVDEFGSEYEEVLNERFDKIKFVFFVSLKSYERYLRNKYSYLAANKIVEFIKENGILTDVYVDSQFKDVSGYVVKSGDEEGLFDSIFDRRSLDFDFEKKHINVFGIYSFYSSLDYDSLNAYAKQENIAVGQFVRNNRCDFLRNIGKYPMDYSNEMICNDGNYLNLCRFYERLMKEYNSILSDVQASLQSDIDIFNKLKNIRDASLVNNFKRMLEDLTEYLSDEDKKKVVSGNYNLDEIDFFNIFFYNGLGLNNESRLENLSTEEAQELYSFYCEKNNLKIDIVKIVRNAREKALRRYNKEMLGMFTIEANFDLSNIDINTDLSSTNMQAFGVFDHENGIEQNRVIFFDPFACDSEYLDIHLRHEIWHLLTSSIQRKDGLDIVKVGNAEYIYSGEKLIAVNNEFYNELITQKKATENTRISFQNGVYILSSNGISFPFEFTSIYDEYLLNFDKVYSKIPQSVMVSQMEEDNENLYSFISLDRIRKIEDSLKKYVNIPDDILSKDSSENKMT